MRATPDRAGAPAGAGRQALGVFALVMVWFAVFGGLWTRVPLIGDTALFSEYAARVADGEVPHADFRELKPTGFLYAALPFLRAGRLLGAPDWASARFFALAALAALAAVTCFTARRLTAPVIGEARAAGAGLLAGLGVIALRCLPMAAVVGPEPKVLTLLCVVGGMAALLAGRPLLAGAVAGFAPFHWQPGVLAWLIPLAMALRMPGGLRTGLRFAAGSALTVAFCFGGLAALGALDDFWSQSVVEAMSGIGGEERGSGLRVDQMVRLTWAVAGWELLAAAPLLALAVFARRWELWPLAAVLIIYGLWSLLDFQGALDLIVIVVPAMALAAAEGGRRLAGKAVYLAAALLLAVPLLPHPFESEVTLARQRESADLARQAIRAPATARIFALEDASISLLTGHRTIGRELFAMGLHGRLERNYPGGAAAWVADRFAEAPAAVVLGRAIEPELRALLDARLQTDGWRLLDSVRRERSYGAPTVDTELWVPGG